MSVIEIKDEITKEATYTPTKSRGELISHRRVLRRGKAQKQILQQSYVAIFSFLEPLIMSEHEVPDQGGYFILENGLVELTQLIGRFETPEERSIWLNSIFDVHS